MSLAVFAPATGRICFRLDYDFETERNRIGKSTEKFFSWQFCQEYPKRYLGALLLGLVAAEGLNLSGTAFNPCGGAGGINVENT